MKQSKKFVRKSDPEQKVRRGKPAPVETGTVRKGVYGNHSPNPHYLEAKKSLGQNFLKNTTIIKRIADAGEIKNDEIIIEIGPGTGDLTIGLLEAGGTVIAIEKDRRAIPILENRFAEAISNGKLHIIEGDYLEMDIIELIHGHSAASNTVNSGKKTGKFKIIANIPYYITGLIIRKSLELSIKPEKLIFLVQKEVAERMVEKDGKSSILSHSLQAYGEAQILCIVSKGNFVPAPRVDSAVIVIDHISSHKFDQVGISEALFFDVLHAGFGHKRKKLLVNLLEYIEKTNETRVGTTHIDDTKNEIRETLTKDGVRKVLTSLFQVIGLDENVRAEELDNDTWFKISKEIKGLIS